MNRTQVTKAMQAAGISGKISGKGENWEVDVVDDASKDAFLAKVSNVGAKRHTMFSGWTLRPMAQVGLPFGTLDAAEQGSLFG